MKNSRSGEKIKLTSIDELLGVVNEESAMEIEIKAISPFKGHPFKVIADDKMEELINSVKESGVITPVLLRPAGENHYEMISGHRRMYAARKAGLSTVPAIVRDMTDDEAVIAMVDANIQREELLPSEKAFAYKMKLNAMKRQAGRPSKNNSGQNDQNLSGAVSRDILAEQVGESSKQIQRYIRLTELIGTKVVMNGVEYTVEDTGAFARYGVDFDVYYDDHAAASAHGHQTWECYLADDNGRNEITVTETSAKKILYVTLLNRGLDAVARENLNEEQLILYNALNTTLGNRNYLWDTGSISGGSGGMDYEIPPEALEDEEFARIIREAEKYLGVPYVWGGYSPSGFDCSGFVSYVVNHCGNGWNYGRLTAEGLRGQCTFVSPAEAKPGDLIFFQGTYNTSGASHIGIYVGNGMMIHCGDPVQYANVNSSYWKQHFLSYGRLP